MVTTLPASQLGFIAVVIALVTPATSGIAALLQMFTAFKNNANLFNWTVRATNIFLCVLAVVLAEVTLGTFDLHNWVAYLNAAIQSVAGSQLLYAAVVARQKAYNTSLQPTAVSTPTPTTAPDGKNAPVTPA